MEFIKETPSNIDGLVKKAGNKNNWEERLAAVQELGKYDCRQSRDVLTRIALHDRVYKVKETAFRYAQGLGVTKEGKPLRLGKKDIKYSPKDISKTFARVKREAHLEEFNLDVFKEKFKIVSPEMYNVMEYEKKGNFEVWIRDGYNKLK